MNDSVLRYGFIALVLAGMLVVVVSNELAERGRIAARTATAVPSVFSSEPRTWTTREGRYGRREHSGLAVRYSFRAGGTEIYAADLEFEGNDPASARVCYDPADPANSDLIGPWDPCGEP